MDVFSKDRTIVSDVVNRILNCREIKDLYVFGECGDELGYLYPAVHVIRGQGREGMTGDVAYIHITDRTGLEEIIPWIAEEKDRKDFIIYLTGEVELSDREAELLGHPHYLNRFSNLQGVLFLTGISFRKPQSISVPDGFKVLAVLHIYNEADILDRTVRYLLGQGIDLYLLDNWSDDGSYEIARKYQENFPGRIYLERFPDSGGSGNYEWYKQLQRTEEIGAALDYDWFIHYDVDEVRVSPWQGVTLREAIYWIDRQGYNCIENTVIDFRITSRNSDNIFMEDTFFDFRHLKLMFDQVKTWKKSGWADLKSSAGHFVHIPDPKIYPLKFLNRHYPLRSMEQAEKKVFRDRLPRFRKERGERGWHAHYDEFKEKDEFVFDRLGLLYWQKDTFYGLYIPLFLECGIRWDVNPNLTKIKIPDLENKKVVLYGAGNIGRRVYMELIRKNQIVAWVDKQSPRLPSVFCERQVLPHKIKEVAYDFVLIAVKKGKVIQSITEELIHLYGVPEEKILGVETAEGIQEEN